MSIARHHAEWLSLVEVSGPFLSMPVLMRVFNTGLIAHDPEVHRTLRLAHDEWEESLEARHPDSAIHRAWVNFILRNVLEFRDDQIATGQAIQQTWQTRVVGEDDILRPDFVIMNPAGRSDAGKARLFVQVYPANQDLEKRVAGKSSPDTRMAELLRNTGVCLGLVTNGHRWMLVNVLPKDTAGFASWYANLWLEEPLTLRAFRSLLSMERFFGVAEKDTLEAMFIGSLQNQQDVTDQLGYQVRRAVEVIIQTLDQADQDHGRQLLGDVSEAELYEAALTVMMRLVFLFCAEERELLLLGDPLYDQHYAVSTLRAQLRETADQHGEEVLERRHDAWCRLLSTFRAVYGGVDHERMTLPAYGGNLFNPDRFPFLEGRKRKTTWRDTPCDPLPVDNRTVLHLLEALQTLQVKVPGGGAAESRRLSFRALDIEQIGHVYEGLLDHTAKRTTEPVLGLAGAKGKEPEIPLAELETREGDKLIEYLKEQTGKSVKALEKALAVELDTEDASRFHAACGNDDALWTRVRPYAGLVRDDDFGHPVVIRAGSVYVTEGTDRRSSGTHYTPRSLTEPIVQYTLEPLVYVGPAEGKPKEEWKLRTPAELLELNICDMACGSGAFLVQACRYLAERLVEAWEETEKQHPGTPGITPEGSASTGKAGETLIPKDSNERLIYARRIIAQRCLYGVDKNPLAAEMAKLSLWLLTLQKDRPFTFLDHAIRSGDSLVGVASEHQLASFSLDGKGMDRPLLTAFIKRTLDDVRRKRRQISELPDNSAEDVQQKALMLAEVEETTKRLTFAANYLLAACWEATSETDRDERLEQALAHVEGRFNEVSVEELGADGKKRLTKAGVPKPLHWLLEFPEVFMERGGFDGVVGNPPFVGGTRISTTFGLPYLKFLQSIRGRGGRADLCTYFFLRAFEVGSERAGFGLLATNTIAEGDTRELGLESLVNSGCIINRAIRSRKWPGTASLEVSHVWIRKSRWAGGFDLDDVAVLGITPFLTELVQVTGKPYRLAANEGGAGKGVDVCGDGFFVDPEQASMLIAHGPRYKDVLFPYLNGADLNSDARQAPSRWIIHFFDWPLDRLTSPQGYIGPVAADYPECLAILERMVKSERANKSKEVAKAPWWQLWRQRRALFDAVKTRSRVLVRTRVSEYHMFTFVSSQIIFSDTVIVFPYAEENEFAVLQSSINEAWSRLYSSTLETRMLYTLADAFETYTFPIAQSATSQIGVTYHEHRRQVMLARQEGLTKTYNRFHDRQQTAEDIQKLRDLHVEMDNAVAAAYGWADLDLGHGFHETKQGLRFTISETARREVLARLLKLNHERYAEEVAQGLHEKKKGGSKGTAGGRKRRSAPQGPTLF